MVWPVSLSIDRLEVETSNRNRVAQVAVRLFAEKGFAATGIREIGRQLGMTSAALYHYVERKEQLLVDVMTSCLAEYLRGARAAVDSSSDPVVQLCRLVHFHVATECINPLTSRVTDREVRSLTGDDHAQVMGLRDELEGLYRDVIVVGAEQDAFELIDPVITRLALIEMCNSVANWYRPDGSLTVVELQERYAQLARRLVGATTRQQVPVGPDSIAVRLASEPPVSR
jgi:TetR/AcrR family transcriptional regulator, cholesterol catabolism regulator